MMIKIDVKSLVFQFYPEMDEIFDMSHCSKLVQQQISKAKKLAKKWFDSNSSQGNVEL